MTDLHHRLSDIRRRIAAACDAAQRHPSEVELLAVSKFHPVSAIREALAEGLVRFGENYVQEGSLKAQELPEAHFLLLGPLQRNKAKPALQHFREILTLDRPELALRLRTLAMELGVIRPIWIQVDIWDEATKMGGAREAELEAILSALAHDPALPLQGFMAIPPPHLPGAFREMADLRARWQDRLGCALKLSMGMSDDLEEAIAAGSNQVRIGTALFGSRS